MSRLRLHSIFIHTLYTIPQNKFKINKILGRIYIYIIYIYIYIYIYKTEKVGE